MVDSGRVRNALVAAWLALAVFPSATAAAQTSERHVVTTQGADYFGGDYDVRKGVDLPACTAACRDDAACQAFTFNTAAGWCFLKKEVGELRSVAGAVSGRIVAEAQVRPDVEAERVAELPFLAAADLDAARRFTGALGNETTDGRGADAVAAEAAAAASGGDLLRADDLYRAALAKAPERLDLWQAYADVVFRATSDDYDTQQRLAAERMAATVNAFLRSVSPPERAFGLELVGYALTARQDWKPAIRAYRASLAVLDDATRRATLDKLVADHGFRIVDNSVDAAAPRICVAFSDRVATDPARGDIADFVVVEGGDNLAVEAEGQQVCIDGVQHGSRYHVTVRAGLPAADGETLAKTAELDLFVRDRAPSARFVGTAYVVPAGGEPTIPIVTVNTSRVNATLYRIGDRQLASAIAAGTFLDQIASYQAEQIETKDGEKVWTGSVEVGNEVNREITTAIPVGELSASLKPGAYVLTAEAANSALTSGDEEWAAKATQWFIVTDLGLTTLSGNDGLSVMVRSLGTAGPVTGVALKLVAVNNEVLGEAITDAAGFARFAPGLLRGTGGMAAGLLTAQTAAGDYSFLDMSRAAMDLADRGVDGRAPPKPVDVFLSTDRGIYRAGETVHATALVRDAKAVALPDLPLTLTLTRPDGKEARRQPLPDGGLGGSVADLPLAATAQRGTWRVRVYADVKSDPLAEATVLVEDFQPERLDFDLKATAAAFDPATPGEVTLAARFLYGAPGGGLGIEGETTVKPTRALAAFPGYVFGLETDAFTAEAVPFSGGETDENGGGLVEVTLPDTGGSSRPLDATVTVRVLDPGGRPVERSLTLPVAATAGRIGVKPLFTTAEDNSRVAFEAVALDPTGARVAAAPATWSLYKVATDYQWYRTDGRWNYEIVDRRSRVDGGSVDIGADMPARIEAGVEWGTYELEIAGPGDTLPATLRFEAGWSVEAKAPDTPEALKVSLDKPRYAVGETAHVHLDTRFAGTALVMVVDDRLVATQAVAVTGTSADVDVPVTRDWGPGAYVTAVLYRPMDIEARRMPARAVGLAWAGVDPAGRDLDVRIDAPAEMRPRGDAEVGIRLANLPAGTEAYVTLAAVDLGILNLTRYETPDPEAYYFGQRRLGVAIRDLYNQLVDRMQGVRGIVRSGGDAGAVSFSGPTPTETLVAFHSGVVRVGADGTARLAVPLPDFNGTVRLTAMAWTRDGVGHAQADLLVRDPVVAQATLPLFLAPGDRSRLSLSLASTGDVAGAVAVAVSAAGPAVSVDPAAAATTVQVAAGARETMLVPVTAVRAGEDTLTVAITLPDGERLEKRLAITVRDNEPPVATTSFVTLAPGASLDVTPDAVTGLVPGTASVQIAASNAGRLNVPAILRALDRYPYGCTEQLTSRAMPLVYLNDVSLRAGLGGDPDVRARVGTAIAGVLANQSAAGSFGLWGPGGEDLWLDAYVSDFLTRARARGFDVPAESFDLALANLKNKLAYAGDFSTGGEAVAYALYVLAANGRAAIGDLRYYVETKLDAFSTPLAKAQLGAALSLYGDAPRAQAAFRAALAGLDASVKDEGYRADYGTKLRDGAAVLTLASETIDARQASTAPSGNGVDLVALSGIVERERATKAHTSTQEDGWSLMAAHALIESLSQPKLAVNGEAVDGPVFRGIDVQGLGVAPTAIQNRGERPVEVGVTVRGVPAEPEPAGGVGYSLKRSYFTLDGEPANLAAVEQGARLVVVLDVTTTETGGARLLLDDPLPAGFEIDNPHILAGGDVAALDWLTLSDPPAHVEFRADRFVAAWDRSADAATAFQFAYIVRAVSPGSFKHPAAIVEDMYRPDRRARTEASTLAVVGPLR